jgi:hypothetical protein
VLLAYVAVAFAVHVPWGKVRAGSAKLDRAISGFSA